MSISLNVEDLVNMAIDVHNGHINQHFLVRLLKVIVRHTNLSEYYVDFDGADKNRAQDVSTGIIDMSRIPLNSKFTFTRDDEYAEKKRPKKKSINSVKKYIEKFENAEETSPSIFESNGELFEVESVVSTHPELKISNDNFTAEKSVISEKYKESQLNYKPIEEKFTLQNTIETIVEQLELLTSRVNELQTLHEKTLEMYCQDNSKLISESAEIYEGSQDSIYYPPSVKDISNTDVLNEKKEQISIHSNLSLNKFFRETRDYCLYSADRKVVQDLIEKLVGKVQKIDFATKLLKRRIKNFKTEDDSDDSTDSEFHEREKITYSNIELRFEKEKHNYERLDLNVNLEKLDKSANGQTYIDIFGTTQKMKDLHLGLTIRDFREFDLDYRTNFQTIVSFLKLHKDILNKHKADINELKETYVHKENYQRFEKAVMSTHKEIKEDIKEHILKNTESKGIVRSMIEGSCIACGTPARMKTTNFAPICFNNKDYNKGLPPKEDRKKKELTNQFVRDRKINTNCDETIFQMKTEELKSKSIKNVPSYTVIDVFPGPIVSNKIKSKLEYDLDRLKLDILRNPTGKDLQRLESVRKKLIQCSRKKFYTKLFNK